jgi:uncharacterized repeat protein (TIGR01451 family)
LNADINPNGGLTSGWFEYGPSPILGLRTAQLPLGSGSSFMPFSYAVSGLLPNTTYYYRAVAQNQAGTSQGNILSFVTTGGGLIPEIEEPIIPPIPPIIVVPGGGGVACISLVPTLNISQPLVGQEFIYTVTYRNGCNFTITNTKIQITLPLEVDFISSDNPFFTRNGNMLTYTLGSVQQYQEATINIHARVQTTAKHGDALIFSAIFDFNDAKGKFQTLVAYLTAFVGAGEVTSTSTLGASLRCLQGTAYQRMAFSSVDYHHSSSPVLDNFLEEEASRC